MDGCTTVFTSLSNARIHYLNDHCIPNGYIKCCDMKLKTQIDVKDHIAWHKDPASFKYILFSIFEKLFIVHVQINRVVSVNCNNLPKFILFVQHMTIDRCKDCGREYKSGRALSRHTMEVHSKGSLVHKCGTCQKRFKEKAELEEHMLLHEKKPKFSCPEPNCDKRYECLMF